MILDQELSSCPFFLSGLPHYVQASRYAGKEKGLNGEQAQVVTLAASHRSKVLTFPKIGGTIM